MSVITLEEPNIHLALKMSMSDLLGDLGESLSLESICPDSLWPGSSSESPKSESMAKTHTVESIEEGAAHYPGEYDGLTLEDITPSSTPFTGEHYQPTETQKGETMAKQPMANPAEEGSVPHADEFDRLLLADITPSSTPIICEYYQPTGAQKSEIVANPPIANSAEGSLVPHADDFDRLLLADITPSYTPITSEYYQFTGTQKSENMAKPPVPNSAGEGPVPHAGEFDRLLLADITPSSMPYTGEYYQNIAMPTIEARNEPLISNEHPSPNHKKSDQALEPAGHLLTSSHSTLRAPPNVLGKRKEREQPKTKKQKRFRGALRGRDYPLHENDYSYVDAPSQNMDNGYWKCMALRYEEKASKVLKKSQEDGNTLPPGASLRARAEVPGQSHKEASLDFWYSEYVHVVGVLQQLDVDVELEKRRKRSPTPTPIPTFNPQQNVLLVPPTQSQLPQNMPQGLGQLYFMDPTYYNIHGAQLYPAMFQGGTGYPSSGQKIAAPVPFNFFSQPVIGQYGQQQ